jgi:hypothetical protein
MSIAKYAAAALAPLIAATVPAQEGSERFAEADAQFARRAEVAGAVGRCEPVDTAIDLYRSAVRNDPNDLVAVSRLLRALHFRGAYCSPPASGEEKPESKTRRRAFFDEGRQLGQAAVDRLEAGAIAARRSAGGKGDAKAARVQFLRSAPGAGLLFIWTAAHWGEWASLSGKWAAARAGIGGRLRDLAQTVVDIDPALEDAAGYRLLGRLHADAPKIPFVTGWVSREKGLSFLRRAYETGPRHPVTWFFLAEAILDHEPAKQAEAIALLERCAAADPRPDTVIEDRRYAELARARLAARTK